MAPTKLTQQTGSKQFVLALKRSVILLTAVTSFLFAFAKVAKADVNLTVSNMNFNSVTGAFDFDYDAGGVTLNHQLTLRTPFDAHDFNYDVNNDAATGHFTCTPTHCSGTYAADTGSFTCAGTGYYIMSSTNVPGQGEVQYNSNSMTAAEFSDNCISTPGFAVSNITFDHSTHRYSFDFSGYPGGNVSTESVAIQAENESWGYGDQPASCTNGSTPGSGHCAGIFNFVSQTFTCTTGMYILIYGYNPAGAVKHGLTNLDPTCTPVLPPSSLFPGAIQADLDMLWQNSAVVDFEADLTLPGYGLDCWNDIGFTATVYNGANNQPMVTMTNTDQRHLCGYLDVNNRSKTWTVYPDFTMQPGTYWVYAHSNNANMSWVSNNFTLSPYIRVDSTEWLDASTFRIHYSNNLHPEGSLGLIFVESDGSFHAGAWSWPLPHQTSGYVDFGGSLPGQDSNSLYWGAEAGYTRYYELTNDDGVSEMFRLPAYGGPPANMAPTVNFTASNTTLNEGDTFTANGSFMDPDSTAWTATADYGDGSGVQPLTLNTNKTFSLSHVYVDNGLYTITVSVTDDGNLSGTSTGSGGGVVVNNPAPSVPPITPPTNVDQSGPAVINVAFSDYGNQSHTATVNWGDGSGNQFVPVSGSDFSSGHSYQNPGTYTVIVTVTDSEGATTTQTLTITVLNVAPHVGTINFPSSVGVSNSTPLSVYFTDPGTEDTHTARINWGDGNITNGIVSETNGSGSVSGNHAYATPGAYTVTVVVTDDDNGTGQNATSTTAVKQASALSPAGIWIGLKNSDDIGAKFDLRVEAYKGSVLIASGQLDSLAGGSSGFNNAHLASIPFDSFAPIDLPAGSILNFAVSVRNACVGSGKTSGIARLWYDDSAAGSKFNITIAGTSADYYLRDQFGLATTAGAGPKRTIDVQAGAKCSAFKPFGTWSVTL